MTPQIIILDSPAKRDRAVKWLAQIPLDEILELTIKPYKLTRSQEQNARYWLIVAKIAEFTGHDRYEIHEFLKARFLGITETEIAGETVKHQRSSAKLKVGDFAEYMEKCESFAITTLGIFLE